MDDYTPPEDGELTLKPLEEVKQPEPPALFDFNPNRSDTELKTLNKSMIDPQSGPIRYWSFSTLSVFKECPLRVKFRRIDGLKEPSGPAAERGNQVHDQAEQFVNGSKDTLPEAKKIECFENRFNALREEYQAGNVELEQDWWFNSDWAVIAAEGKPKDNDALWYIAKLDAFVREDKTSAVVIDYKTGRKYEMKHSQQAMQYAIAAFMRYPELEFIRTEFWYLDQGEELIKTYNRDEAMVMMTRVTDQALELTTCHTFNPKPSARNCKWCHFAQSGDCEYAFEAL